MIRNPLYISTKVTKEYLPIKVYCVVDDFGDYNDETIRSIRDYCNNRHVQFLTRMYSPYKYSDDRNCIHALPAFHIYIKKSYFDTFYPTTRPIQHITDSIDIYSKQLQEKKKRQEKWRRFFAKYFKWRL